MAGAWGRQYNPNIIRDLDRRESRWVCDVDSWLVQMRSRRGVSVDDERWPENEPESCLSLVFGLSIFFTLLDLEDVDVAVQHVHSHLQQCQFDLTAADVSEMLRTHALQVFLRNQNACRHSRFTQIVGASGVDSVTSKGQVFARLVVAAASNTMKVAITAYVSAYATPFLIHISLTSIVVSCMCPCSSL